ncbi:uncharacterized protein LOC134223580 [Armigeres subalbatus]|uniref:uncharacterized protein LOC134223580 n=1 Tax=Armigeres subalbatus TaxID=124917 RepID=UPI002ED32950
MMAVIVALKFALLAGIVLAAGYSPSVEAGRRQATRNTCPNTPNAQIRTCPDNEEFQCCGACEQLGCDKRISNVRCFMCPSDCYCKEGYIRETAFYGNGINRTPCIPIDQCPTNSQ